MDRSRAARPDVLRFPLTRRPMKELLRTNDAVRLSWLQALLGDSGIDSLILDHHTSLVGGRVRLRQPADGYRAAIDPVFLAAAVPAEPHQLVLDVGCGPGAAMFCLAARVPHCRVVGLEMQRELVRLAGDNAILNALETRVSVMIGDLSHPP